MPGLVEISVSLAPRLRPDCLYICFYTVHFFSLEAPFQFRLLDHIFALFRIMHVLLSQVVGIQLSSHTTFLEVSGNLSLVR